MPYNASCVRQGDAWLKFQRSHEAEKVRRSLPLLIACFKSSRVKPLLVGDAQVIVHSMPYHCNNIHPTKKYDDRNRP